MTETKRRSKCSWTVELEVQDTNNQRVGLDMEEHEMGSKLQSHNHLFSRAHTPPLRHPPPPPPGIVRSGVSGVPGNAHSGVPGAAPGTS